MTLPRGRWTRLALAVAVVAALYLTFVRVGQHRPAAPEGEAAGPVAAVRTKPLRKGTIAEKVLAYGTVVAVPGSSQSISVSYESRVRRFAASAGERVAPHTSLLEIEPSPETLAKLERAEAAYASAKKALGYVDQRFDLHLATNEERLQARRSFEEADLTLTSLRRQGARREGQTIRSPFAGVVAKIGAQKGAIVPAGAPLIELVPDSGVEVQLGVEIDNVSHLEVHQPVTLKSVQRGVAVTGRVRVVGRTVNPATRLVDILVSLPASGGLLVGEYVQGKIRVASTEGLIAPRAAVLPEEGHFVIFTIEKGRARKRIVRLGLENEKEVEVLGEGLSPGEPVVVLGNYELEDGMAVRRASSP
jgi:membrane fusion protein (multidrug efflux system)